MAEKTAVMSKTERVPTHETMFRVGLCRDCMQAATCSFPRDPERPVRQCEEFAPAPSAKARGVPLVVVERIFSAAQDAPAGELKGLCVQCKNRDTCNYPKPPGGVWQCDELA